MYSAVLMAGYNNKRAVKKYSKIVAEHYGEKFIESGYKPLREFKTLQDGKEILKPLIQFTLEKIDAIDSIDEIIITGHQMLLERRLGRFLSRLKKPYRIINQNSRLSSDINRQFEIIPRKVKFNSVAGNMIKGYAATRAYKEKKHALFLASDSPLTTIDYIERFLKETEKHEDRNALAFSAVQIDHSIDKLGRYPLWLINDTEYQLGGNRDEFGREGFRLSGLMYANPFLFDVNTANTAYNLRKALSPNVQIRLFRITRNLGYKNIYSKHFFKKDLSVKEVENITSAFFNGRVKVIPMVGEEASYDYDGTDFEYRGITEMLNTDQKS